MSRTHHALLRLQCARHGDHVTHLISRDDIAWIFAHFLQEELGPEWAFKADLQLWTEGDGHGKTHAADPSLKSLDDIDF